MDYDELVAKVIELLQREKRVPYRVLRGCFRIIKPMFSMVYMIRSDSKCETALDLKAA